MEPLKILFVAAECQPFIKTGGLADVAGALPKTLHRLGHDVRIVLPRYSDIDGGKHRLLPMMPEMKVQYGPHLLEGSVLRCSFPGTQMPVYFIDEPDLFHRRGLYGHGRMDFADNDRRFAFFSMATLWMLKGLDWQPDIIQTNDWQTGLLPALLRHHPEVTADSFYESMRTVFALHNIAYQGNMDKALVPAIGLPWDVFTHEGLEFYGKASYLKSGLVYSDALVTVSPTYSREIQQEEFGAGLHNTFRERALDLHGILNGIDVDEWDPGNDKYIEKPFSADNLEGKAACKEALQEFAGLPRRPDLPVVVMISRLITNKGLDLVINAMDDLLQMDAQFYILGSGEEEYEAALRNVAVNHPDKFAAHIEYEHKLMHRILAGADMLLMPSAYEPCGLTQLYAMRYGTIPIARETGGLADTIFHATEPAITSGKASGFLFKGYTGDILRDTIAEALALKRNSPNLWSNLVQNAMRQDFSWDRSARDYLRLYEEVLARKNR